MISPERLAEMKGKELVTAQRLALFKISAGQSDGIELARAFVELFAAYEALIGDAAGGDEKA